MFSRISLIILASVPAWGAAYAGSYYPPLAAAPPAKPAGHAAAIDELYNPEAGDKNHQAILDNLKERYENILVTYFFLRRCKQADFGDYHIIISALAQDMASVNAPGRLQYDILTAAQGSYKEVYARSSCKDAGPLSGQYAEFIRKTAANIPKD
ncbi:MAG: hypothetical protein KGI29_10175 [Pseudomonadota bacterium]|nr:hypothetical protein [Pseudomonadota bacterium]MDE3037134.1 hypothetical protein [Pseudomonadota bacterium]